VSLISDQYRNVSAYCQVLLDRIVDKRIQIWKQKPPHLRHRAHTPSFSARSVTGLNQKNGEKGSEQKFERIGNIRTHIFDLKVERSEG